MFRKHGQIDTCWCFLAGNVRAIRASSTEWHAGGLFHSFTISINQIKYWICIMLHEALLLHDCTYGSDNSCFLVLQELSGRARDDKLKPRVYQGGSFTLVDCDKTAALG